jgi:gliding motility-associated-like protein
MRLLTLYIFLFISYSAICQNPELKRICPGRNNNITWNNPSYPCTTFFYYIVWASEKKTDPFVPIDSIPVDAANSYTHLNASPYSFYYIERRDSCGPIYNHLSDTLGIDDTPTPIMSLDSVSVDILTNRVVLGWSKNPTPDFDKYIVYRDSSSNFIPLDPSGTRDTFYIDNTGNDPQQKPLSYDINTYDSCGNPSIFKTPHSTVHLTYKVDTCSKTVSINWTHYFGWRAINSYEIYENPGTGFTQIAIVAGSTNNYTRPIILGNTYEYFVRAVKDTSVRVSSSSNKINFNTRKRIDPSFTRINYVTTDNKNTTDVVFNFTSDAAAETKYFSIVFSDVNQNEKERVILNKSDLDLDIHSGLKNTSRYLLKIFAHDLCDSVSGQTDTSTNILLTKQETSNRSMNWNSYFTWNTGVEKYVIYRGTGEDNNYLFSPWQETFDTFIVDSEAFDNVLSYGICYYIKAIKAGSADTISESNILCFPSPFTVFIPNAFVPNGLNNLFRPEGSSIDYQVSTIQIYDRWGKMVHSGIIGSGWNGKDQNGQECSEGVYHYKASIISIKNEKQTKDGTVTLLR